MCITFLINSDAENLILGRFKLILLNNRDEDFSRATSALTWSDGILAGRDEYEKVNGTWLGIDKKGRIGNLLAITEPKNISNKLAPSRGELVKNYLTGQTSAKNYLYQLGGENYKEFNGFQIVENFYELYSYTNRLNICDPIKWPKGIYGFSNSPRSIPFKKVIYGEKLFYSLINKFSIKENNFTEEDLINDLYEIASNQEINFPDEQISLQIGSSNPLNTNYKLLCSIFVDGHLHGRNYGTRSTSIILVDKENNVTFHERRIIDISKPMNDPSKWEYSVEKFLIEK